MFKCRICSNENLETILDYGPMPLVNKLNDGGESKKYPLELVHCPECGLVQITETVHPKELFSDYLYFSSQSATDHWKNLAAEITKSRHLTEDSIVVDIASNDGYLLQYYDVPVLGIEPAANVAQVAIDKGIPTLVEFFGEKTAWNLDIKADVIHAHNVLAHVADLHGFVEGLRILLKPSGIIVIEVPFCESLFENCEFDTVYHEHLCYFSLRPLVRLFDDHELEITNVSTQEIHGGSLRLYVEHKRDYSTFSRQVGMVEGRLISYLNKVKSQGKRIAAYGAAAKGCVLLNMCGLDNTIIDYVVDSTPAKQGKYIPGTGIQVYPPIKLIEDQPDYCLILAWNFAKEIMDKETEYRGKFILPNPLTIC